MVIMQEIKIGVVASMLMLEIVAYYSKQNKDLFDVLEDIYNTKNVEFNTILK